MGDSSNATRGAGSPSKIGQHPRSRVKQFAPHTIHDVGRGFAEDVEIFVDALLARQAPDGSFGMGRVDRTALAAVALRMASRGTSPLTGTVALPDRPEQTDG